MKITITGSLGNISKPLTQILVKKNHAVTVISSNPERQKEIEALGATAAIGSMTDPGFLTNTFKGAEVVYCMEALNQPQYFDKNLDYMGEMLKIANSYKQAILQSGVKKVVHLSSTGAHTNQGVGLIALHYNVENILKQLPDDVIIKTMRPAGFYYNILNFIPTIKSAGAIFQNFGGDEKQPWVSPLDISEAIAEEIESPFNKRLVRYIASDEVSTNELTELLGDALGKPDLKWVVIPDEKMYETLIGIGMNAGIAKGMVEMGAARREDILYKDYFKNRPLLGKSKLIHYAKEFAAIYNR